MMHGNLRPAHSGYRYQDIATAYMLVRSLVDRFDSVTVDRKDVPDDRIDDLETVAKDIVVRRQFKSSENPVRPISASDFTRSDSTLRIDRLVQTYVRSGKNAADEYRLCATWQPPAADDGLSELLEPIDALPTIEHWPSQMFRFRVEQLWPAGAQPRWPYLSAPPAGGNLTRKHACEFLDRFTIELALPIASTDLRAPGPLERAVVETLRDRVGVGRYPNNGRQSADVAALAVALATLARTQQATLTPRDVEHALNIRTDFGRVAQAFPIDESTFCDRPHFRDVLRDAALAGSHQLVTGPPGAGKSWELTRLAAELEEAGAIVARHYCYLEPGDAVVERRVTSEVFFANIIAELTDAAPELADRVASRYAVGLTELEDTLRHASRLDRRVVLIIDGLDHIARVRASSLHLAQEDTDIIEQLSTLDIPAEVSVLFGAQPGRHLDPLRQKLGTSLAERHVDRWSLTEIKMLADRHDVTGAMSSVGIVDRDQQQISIDLLCERADGNPLFARYLSHGLSEGLKSGAVLSPVEWLNDVPEIHGDISVYYQYLYGLASSEGQAIADVLAVIDFSITDADLREILPEFVGNWIPGALTALAPILDITAAQGGIRIFHESFRRFMGAEQERNGRSIAFTLAPVIRWLEARGLLQDAKSYRFLLPALRRAERHAEVLALINSSFVSDSVAHAHPQSAIERNIALAADIAGRQCDWSALARCAELQRAAYTCFEGFVDAQERYYATYAELFGVEALGERLLFDGRPTMSRSDGLLACSLIDDQGGIAPWSEYLTLEVDQDQEAQRSLDHDDGLTREGRVALAAVHGRLRLGEVPRIVRRLYVYLRGRVDDFDRNFIRAVSARIARAVGPQSLERIADRAMPTRRGGARISGAAACTLYLGVADEFYRRGESEGAARYAGLALRTADVPERALDCVLLGAPAEQARALAVPPHLLAIAVGPDDYIQDSVNVRRWVASVRLLATDPTNWPSTMAGELQRLSGEGWYRCWLRFVLLLATVEGARRHGRSAVLDDALAELTRDTRPFIGKPRACDLYRIWGAITDSLTLTFSLAQTAEEWRLAVAAITKASGDTQTRLDREDGGPISTSALLDVLMQHSVHPIGGDVVRSAIETEIEQQDNGGTYYGTHAEFEMRRACLAHRRRESVLAQEAWSRCAILLTAYGFHKDVTLLDPIESAPTLMSTSAAVALRALEDVQPLTAAVIAHTDGRSTQYIPNAWFRSVLAVDVPVAIWLLARTVATSPGWFTDDAIVDVAKAIARSANPLLLDAILRANPKKADSDHDAFRMADAKLSGIPRIANADRSTAQQVFRRVVAEIADDGGRYCGVSSERVCTAALAIGLQPPNELHAAKVEKPVYGFNTSDWARTATRRITAQLAFPARPTVVDLLKGLRGLSRRRAWDDTHQKNSAITSLAYCLGELVDVGDSQSAERVLRFFAREVSVPAVSNDSVHPLAVLAEAMESGGYVHMAVIGYALAYSTTRRPALMLRALGLGPETAKTVLALELGHALRANDYNAGTSRHVVERLTDWGDTSGAERAWRSAFEVIALRLPLAPERGWFERLDSGNRPGWSVDQALIALLLAQLGEARLRQKLAALEGVLRSIQLNPGLVGRPLLWWLEQQDTAATAKLLVLQVLASVEVSPWPITKELSRALDAIASGPDWALRQVALRLLKRSGLPDQGVRQTTAVPVKASAGAKDIPMMAIREADVGDILSAFIDVWPDLPDLVCLRAQSLLQSDPASDDRIAERHRLRSGRYRRWIPSTPVLLWEQEVFAQALHTELVGLPERLWRVGEWTPEAEGRFLDAVTPDIRVHVGLAASRSTRPAWECAESLEREIGPLKVLDEDATYQGWKRLGIVERQYLSSSGHHQLPTKFVAVFGGAVILRPGDLIPESAFPFLDGDASLWWTTPAPTETPIRVSVGPLIHLHRRTDWLGEALLLVPSALFHCCRTFAPPAYGDPFAWRDEDGEPAMVLRTWRVRNPEATDAEPFTHEGADLIARPDIVTAMESFLGLSLQELISIRRMDLPTRAREEDN